MHTYLYLEFQDDPRYHDDDQMVQAEHAIVQATNAEEAARLGAHALDGRYGWRMRHIRGEQVFLLSDLVREARALALGATPAALNRDEERRLA